MGDQAKVRRLVFEHDRKMALKLRLAARRAARGERIAAPLVLNRTLEPELLIRLIGRLRRL
jgi:hypothetical protein